MSRSFKDVEYTRVDLDSPRKDFQAADTSVGIGEGEEDDEATVDGVMGATSGERSAGQQPGGDEAADATTDQKAIPSVLSMAYYQRFFNVDTNQVGMRILGSFVPRPGKNLVTDDIRHSPDLYGPFWVCTTLVFTIAIAGNLADYFQATSPGASYVWVYDFRKVTFAAAAVYLYWWLVPLLLWAVSWWRQIPEKYAFLELLCLYGYSLAIYIPVSVLCVIQVAALQWLLVFAGFVLSGAVLARSLWPSVASGERRTAVALLAAAALLHCALAVGFKLYFFHMSSSGGAVTPTDSTTASTAAGPGVATTAVKPKT